MYEEDIDAEPFDDRPLSDFVAAVVPEVDLLTLSGDASLANPGFFPSGLMRRVAKAWKTPLHQLTCAQARVLVGQKFGLRWLASPVAEFLGRYPTAECDLYPGDLMCGTLRVHALFLDFAPVETRALLNGDFGWMADIFAFDPDGALYREAMENLETARRLAGIS